MVLWGSTWVRSRGPRPDGQRSDEEKSARVPANREARPNENDGGTASREERDSYRDFSAPVPGPSPSFYHALGRSIPRGSIGPTSATLIARRPELMQKMVEDAAFKRTLPTTIRSAAQTRNHCWVVVAG